MNLEWHLEKDQHPTVTCEARPLLDGVDVSITYGGLLIGRHVSRDDVEARLWAEGRRRQWLSGGWTEAPAPATP